MHRPHVREFNPAETAGLRLLDEMSLVELRERLAMATARAAEAEAAKRADILREKQVRHGGTAARRDGVRHGVRAGRRAARRDGVLACGTAGGRAGGRDCGRAGGRAGVTAGGRAGGRA